MIEAVGAAFLATRGVVEVGRAAEGFDGFVEQGAGFYGALVF